MATDKLLAANIISRLSRLETVVLGHTADEVDAAGDRRLTKRELATRRGKSTRTIDRDVKRGTLPPPEFENGRAYWWLSALQRYEREHKQSKPQRRFARNNEMPLND
jgi:IS30 family transposase